MSSGLNFFERQDDQMNSDNAPAPEGEAIELTEDVYARIVEQVRQISGSLPENHTSEELTDLVAEMVTELQGTKATSFHSGIANVSSISNIDDEDQEAFPLRMCPAPLPPMTLQESGLSLKQLADLILKIIYLSGSETCEILSRQLRLPSHLVAEALQDLLLSQSIEMEFGQGDSLSMIRYQLTDQGRIQAREVFNQSRYVGPAPVSLEQYTRQCQNQSISRLRITPRQLADSMSPLVLSEEIMKRLGPAVCSGQAILLTGPSGSGKTAIARLLAKLVRDHGGTIYVPYAVSIENQIISVFDPTCHHPVDAVGLPHSTAEAGSNHRDSGASAVDLRWREVRRPILSNTGDLSLDLLQLKSRNGAGSDTAPMQLKANGGVLILDDFSRQRAPNAELLNRWILPLEERKDQLTLQSGKTVLFPYELLTIFTATKSATELKDPAFLRRIRHKLELTPPNEQQFRAIFRRCCELRHIRYDDWIVTRLLTMQYNAEHPPKASDPRDLLDVIESICRFHGEMPHLSEKNVMEAFQECLGGYRIAG